MNESLPVLVPTVTSPRVNIIFDQCVEFFSRHWTDFFQTTGPVCAQNVKSNTEDSDTKAGALVKGAHHYDVGHDEGTNTPVSTGMSVISNTTGVDAASSWGFIQYLLKNSGKQCQ